MCLVFQSLVLLYVYSNSLEHKFKNGKIHGELYFFNLH